MNVLLIHGIGQESYTCEELLASWSEKINSSAAGLLSSCNVNMAYYAKTLQMFSKSSDSAVSSMGTSSLDEDDEFVRFSQSFINDIAISQKISEDEIESASANDDRFKQPMDNVFQRNLVSVISALERKYPGKSEGVLKLITQAYTYLYNPAARAAVDALVKPLLIKQGQIIIAHSLGTVIAFKLLRDMEQEGLEIEIPLFITAGSPLSLAAVKKSLGLPHKKPDIVTKWVNFYDRSDVVTLGRGLDENTFAAKIDNDDTVDNTTKNCHGIMGYLPHARLIAELKASITTK